MLVNKRTVMFGESRSVFLENEAKRLSISVSELLRRIVDGYRGQLVAMKFDLTSDGEGERHDRDGAYTYLTALKESINLGKAYLQQDNAPGDGVCIGWVENGAINLYPVPAMQQSSEVNPLLKQMTPNAIYRELVEMDLVIGARDTTTKVKRCPDGKQHRVLVLKPEALNIGH